jgi:hypothetical protein
LPRMAPMDTNDGRTDRIHSWTFVRFVASFTSELSPNKHFRARFGSRQPSTCYWGVFSWVRCKPSVYCDEPIDAHRALNAVLGNGCLSVRAG